MAFSRTLAALLCAGAAACCAPALADVKGTAQLGNIGYMLADLDPDDGIAPALSFMPHWWGEYNGMAQVSYTKFSRGGTMLVNDGGSRSDLNGLDLDMAYAWDGVSSQATLTQRSTPIEQQLGVAVDVPMDDMSRYAGGSLFGDRIAFTLTPNTAVSFFAALDVDATLGAEGFQSFDAGAGLTLYLDNFEIRGPELSDNVRIQSEDYGLAIDERAYLFASYAHRDDNYIRAYAELTLGAGAHTLAPIPEASQSAMLAAGTLFMAGMGALRRRRPGQRRS